MIKQGGGNFPFEKAKTNFFSIQAKQHHCTDNKHVALVE